MALSLDSLRSLQHPSFDQRFRQIPKGSFDKILGEIRNKAGGAITVVPVNNNLPTDILKLQIEMHKLHFKVEMVSKIADGALGAARRLQQGQ